MNNKEWKSLSKQDKVAILKSAGLPAGLSQLKWSGLTKGERKKIEKASKGSGWYEKAKPTRTHKGIKEVAPRHYEVSAKKEAESALNVPMRKALLEENLPEIVREALESPITNIGQLNSEQLRALNRYVKKGILSKGKGDIYPKAKTVYAKKGYDIEGDRTRGVRELFGVIVKHKEEPAHEEKRETPKDYLLKTLPPFDTAFEKSETERMMDERKLEEGTYEDIVVPYDTGDVRAMRQEAGIAETYNKMPEDWFTADRQKEWEKHEAEGYEGDGTIGDDQTKPYDYYIKTYPLAMEWISKHFKKVTSAKEMEEAVSFYFGNGWKQFEEFLQEKQDEIVAQVLKKEQKAQERKKQFESKYFTTKFRDIDDHNKTECVERFLALKAHPFDYKGISLFAHKDGKEWKATEATTGLDIVRAHQFKGKWQNNSKDEIIQAAKEFIDEKTPEKISELIKYAADTISRTIPCLQVSG